MSAAVSRSDSVAELILPSDKSSVCPPLCEPLGALCGVSPRLTPQRGGPQAVLGALWIISGLLHIGLGYTLLVEWSGPSYQLRDTERSVPLGVLFMFFGVCCVLTERYPRPCLVLLSGILSLFGVALSISAVVWYGSRLSYDVFYDLCSFWGRTTPSPSLENEVLLERCEDAHSILRSLSVCFGSTLFTLSVLDLCLGLSSSIISFKALKRGTTALLNEDKTFTD